MKKILLVIMLLIFSLPVYGQVLEGQVQETWTTNRARNAAFSNMLYQKDLRWAPPVDPYYNENMLAKAKNQRRIGNRTITFFSNGNYAIYEDNSVNTFYFNNTGKLYAVEYDIGKKYPIKSFKYKYPSGDIFTVSIEVAYRETFIFDPTGDQLYHWIG
ncbi:MAG: hypothetical protein AB1782_12245, partial [Cyanobacteriota bacterium]